MDIDILDAISHLCDSPKLSAQLKLCQYRSIEDFTNFSDKTIDKIEDFVQVRCSVMPKPMRESYLSGSDIDNPYEFIFSPGMRNKLIKAVDMLLLSAGIKPFINLPNKVMPYKFNGFPNFNAINSLQTPILSSPIQNNGSLNSLTTISPIACHDKYVEKPDNSFEEFTSTPKNQRKVMQAKIYESPQKISNENSSAEVKQRKLKNSKTFDTPQSISNGNIPPVLKQRKIMKTKISESSNENDVRKKRKISKSEISDSSKNDLEIYNETSSNDVVKDSNFTGEMSIEKYYKDTAEILNNSFDDLNVVPQKDFQFEFHFNKQDPISSYAYYICHRCKSKKLKFKFNSTMQILYGNIKSHIKNHFVAGYSFGEDLHPLGRKKSKATTDKNI